MVNKLAEVAVFLGENGKTAKFYGEGKIVVFSQYNGSWEVSREKEFSTKEIQGIIDFKQTMEGILAFLKPCRIFVGLLITNIPYYFLEKAKFSIWEYDGDPEEFLDYVLIQELMARQNAKKAAKMLETTPENYSILINGIQEKNTVLASKQILLPFLRRGCFDSLEITCSHMPNWLEEEVLRRKLSLQTQEIGRHQVKIILKRKIDRTSLT